MRNRIVGFLFLVFTCSSNVLASGAWLEVVGWESAQNLYRSDRPDDFLGDDPVVGRQACPGLLRYNASNMKAETVLLKEFPDEHHSSGKWLFVMRPGLRWWSGSSVSAADLADYLDRELKVVNAARHVEAVPKVIALNNSVEVLWSKAPGFGPMIFAGRPFWRSATGKSLQFECAGLYSISSVDSAQSMTMQLSKGYTGKYQGIKLLPPNSNTTGAAIIFSADGSVGHASTSIPPRKCNAVLDIPFVTALIWNPASKLVSTPNIRQALTQATPRGEILRTAAADLGSLISAPLLRNHPGYASQQVVPPFNLEVANGLLNAAGLKQIAIGQPRMAADGAVMHLRILRTGKPHQELLEKIISDSYVSLGIEVEFIENLSPENIEKADGALVGVSLPWPSLDLTGFLHSRTDRKMSAFPFYVPNDKSLDELLEAYAASLFGGKPRLDLLNKIHGRFADLELWSMIMGHQFCVKTNSVGLKGKLNIVDPDWFRRQVVD